MNGHTKEPWNLYIGKQDFAIEAGGTICQGDDTMLGWKGNARLIAAAPDLLDALQAALSVLRGIRNDGYIGTYLPQLDWILDGDETGDSTARVAIAKATQNGGQ